MKKLVLTLTTLTASVACTNAATILGADLDYGISGLGNNAFALDFTTQPVWTAGSQRSDNSDPPNRRAGRVFLDLQLDAAIIAAASLPGATASFTFHVDSIGGGVSGTPYTDGLDLRYLSVNAADRNANTLWNTPGSGADQADILTTGGLTGTQTISLTNLSIVSDIAAASPGEYISFGMSNSVGVTTDPVGGSHAETYGFQMNQTTGNYSLSVVPEPGTAVLIGLAGLALILRRRH